MDHKSAETSVILSYFSQLFALFHLVQVIMLRAVMLLTKYFNTSIYLINLTRMCGHRSEKNGRKFARKS